MKSHNSWYIGKFIHGTLGNSRYETTSQLLSIHSAAN